MAERPPRNMTDYEAEYAGSRWDRPARFNFAIDVVDRWASERPDAPAMLHCDDRGNRKVYSWRELAERSIHAALFLRDLGLRPGDGVFTMLPRLAEWWILALGCMRANLVLMPGTTMLTAKDVRYRLELGRARAVVTTAEHLSKFEAGAHADVIGWICIDEAPAPWVRFRTQTVDGARAAEFPDTAADDRMLVYFTSGTTGMPKMVPQTHASYGIGHGVTGKYWLDLGPDDVHFTLSDTGWAKCAWGKVYGPWSQGACSVVYDFRGRFEAKALLDLLARDKVSTFCAPPTAWRAIVLEDLTKFKFPAPVEAWVIKYSNCMGFTMKRLDTLTSTPPPKAAAKLFWAVNKRGVAELTLNPFESLSPPSRVWTYGVNRDVRQLNRGPNRYWNVVFPSRVLPAAPVWLAPSSATRPKTLLTLYSA